MSSLSPTLTATYTARELPAEEWSRLAGTELGSVVDQLRPSCTKVVVVEDWAGAIVGCWAAILTVHVEGVWIAPAQRKHSAVARRLWHGMRAVVREWGTTRVLTGALAPEVRALLERHATPLPSMFLLEL